MAVNISERELHAQENEMSLLRKGLITTNSDYERQDIIRTKVHGALKQAKPPRIRNLTGEEQQAMT